MFQKWYNQILRTSNYQNMNKKDYLKCESRAKYCVFLILYVLLYIPSIVLYRRKQIWLVCERGIDAQDNGYVFYKYLKNNHKSIRTYYVISDKSKDLKKIEKKDVVIFCSIKHFMLCIGCKVQISSHLFGYCPWSNFMLYLRKHKTHNIHVFLQHGITYNNQFGYYKNVCAALDLFICGAAFEQQYICETFGYNEREAILTGFARFDNLFDGVFNDYLVIMPTWRRYLSNVSNEEFKNSDYFKRWFSILNNTALKKMCAENNLKILFYLHLSLQPFSELFSELKDISVIKYGEDTVQELLKRSAILMTDYSSVFFDCLYMNKDVVLYQFDIDEFKQGHYEEGYFDKLDKNIISTETTEANIIKKLNEKIVYQNKNNSERKKNYSNKFFGIKDKNNCNRIYDAIMSKL